MYKKHVLIFTLFLFSLQIGYSQNNSSLENITFSYGRFSNQQYKYFESKYGFGWHSVQLLGVPAEDGITTGWLFCTEFEYTGNIAFTPLTLDIVGVGQNISLENNSALLWGLGFVSLNLDITQKLLGSTLYLSYKYQNFIAESKIVFLKWHKGKDPLFNEQSYYGVGYMLGNEIALGLNCKYYNKQNKFLSFGVKWMFMNNPKKYRI